jgi:hypothetical protein
VQVVVNPVSADRFLEKPHANKPPRKFYVEGVHEVTAAVVVLVESVIVHLSPFVHPLFGNDHEHPVEAGASPRHEIRDNRVRDKAIREMTGGVVDRTPIKEFGKRAGGDDLWVIVQIVIESHPRHDVLPVFA